MMEYRAPQFMFDAMRDAITRYDAEPADQARKMVTEWATSLRLNDGDAVTIPDLDTGEETVIVYRPENREQ